MAPHTHLIEASHMIALLHSWHRANGRISAPALLMLTSLTMWLAPVRAGDGHDHGDAPAAAATAQALPRFTATSDDFELVGVLAGKQLTLYLDRATTNEPVREATIELDVGGQVLKASPTPEGTFQVILPQAPVEGSTPITATVAVGELSDLLAGDIDIHAASSEHGEGAHPSHWRRVAAWALGCVLVAGVSAWLWRARNQRASRIGGAA